MDSEIARIFAVHTTHRNWDSPRLVADVFLSLVQVSYPLNLSKGLGVVASDEAMLYVILSPTGPYYRMGPHPISLLAVGDTPRSWPGGTGEHKLGLNYAPGFAPQRIAAKMGYEQILWLLGDDNKITEAGAMNFFIAVQRDDGGKFKPLLLFSSVEVSLV